MAWAYMVNETTGGTTLVPNRSDVIEAHEQRGWALAEMPAELDPDAPNLGTTVALAEALDETAELKGKELDAALEAAGLPKSGTADEKRARLAEHEATLAETTEEGNE